MESAVIKAIMIMCYYCLCMHVVNGSILTKCTLFLFSYTVLVVQVVALREQREGCLTSHTEQLLPRPVVVSASVQCQLGMSTVCVYVDPEMKLR